MSIPPYGYGVSFFTEPPKFPVNEDEKSSTEGSTEADEIETAKYVSDLCQENEELKKHNIRHQKDIEKLSETLEQKNLQIDELQKENAILKQKNLLKKQKIQAKINEMLSIQRMAELDRIEFRNAFVTMSKSVNDLSQEIRDSRAIGYGAIFLTMINVVSTSLNIFSSMKGLCCATPITNKP